jgi:acetyl-CoA hydrolase
VTADPALDLTRFVRPGDTILWGQGAAEPLTLTEALVAQRASLGGVRVFFGLSFTETLKPEHADHLELTSIGGFGTNARLSVAGVLKVVPAHISTLPGLIESGAIKADVLLVQVSPPDRHGRHSIGVTADYLLPAIRKARVTLAEVNDRTPYTCGDTLVDASVFTHSIETSRQMVQVPPAPAGEAELEIARMAAGLVPDRAVVQFGFGTIPEAVARALCSHRELGIHTGLITDAFLDLVEAGAVTNSHKPIDRGRTVTGLVVGTDRLYSHVHRNRQVMLRGAGHTHAAEVLARFETFVAINSAVEVDLTGQVNSEVAGSRYVGAVGGAVDFSSAGVRSRSGRAIIGLPSTARQGAISRIVARLGGPVTIPRSDADTVITEYGIAELRGQPLGERARRLIAIAHPAFREHLEAAGSSLA